jgi:hypothetical protein
VGATDSQRDYQKEMRSLSKLFSTITLVYNLLIRRFPNEFYCQVEQFAIKNLYKVKFYEI